MEIRLLKKYFLAFISIMVLAQSIVGYAQESSDAPSSSNIIITNNSGKYDTVYVSDLSGGDVVKIYNSATAGKLLGMATAWNYNSEVTINISQLGTDAGKVTSEL